MKLAIVFLSCFIAITLQQQDVYWRSPIGRYPFYYGANDYDVEYNPSSHLRSGLPYNSDNVISEVFKLTRNEVLNVIDKEFFSGRIERM